MVANQTLRKCIRRAAYIINRDEHIDVNHVELVCQFVADRHRVELSSLESENITKFIIRKYRQDIGRERRRSSRVVQWADHMSSASLSDAAPISPNSVLAAWRTLRAKLSAEDFDLLQMRASGLSLSKIGLTLEWSKSWTGERLKEVYSNARAVLDAEDDFEIID